MRNSSRSRRPGPGFTSSLIMGLLAGVMVVGFQNCAVDMTNTTPGASTSGACSATAADLVGMQQVSDYLKTTCSGCHGSDLPNPSGGFMVPISSADSTSTTTQGFAWVNLCAHGGKSISTKLTTEGAHGGDTYPNTGAAAVLHTYLLSHF